MRSASSRRMPIRISQSGKRFFSSNASIMGWLLWKPRREGRGRLLVSPIGVAAAAKALFFGHGNPCYAQQQPEDARGADARDPTVRRAEGEDEIRCPNQPFEKIVRVSAVAP